MSVDNFVILAFVDPIGIVTTPSGMEMFRSDLDPISKLAWRYTFGSTPKFWLILSSQNDPLLGPRFHPPVWSIGSPISLCPQGTRTQFQVIHSDKSPRSLLLSCGPLALPWPGEPRIGMTPVLVILAS